MRGGSHSDWRLDVELRVLGQEGHGLSASLVSSWGWVWEPLFSVWRMCACSCAEVVFGTFLSVRAATRRGAEGSEQRLGSGGRRRKRSL